MWPGINDVTKYVMSKTMNKTDWKNCVFLKSLDDIKNLKNSEGSDIQVHGSGNLTHLAGEVIKIATGVSIQQVPYRGTGPALSDLLGGQISMVITGLSSTVGHIQEGRVRPLAITGKERSSLLPAVPTFSEAMNKPLPELDLGSWWGLFAPAATPEPVVAKINAAVQAFMSKPEFRQRLAKMNIVADPGTPEAMAARLKSEYDGWARVIRSAGIELQ